MFPMEVGLQWEEEPPAGKLCFLWTEAGMGKVAGEKGEHRHPRREKFQAQGKK